MDLVAYPIFKMNILVGPKRSVTSTVWKSLAKNKNGVISHFSELEAAGALHGVAWKFNPHELDGYRTFYNVGSDTAFTNGTMSVWVYALMPRKFAMLRRLAHGGRKARYRTYSAQEFQAAQAFPV